MKLLVGSLSLLWTATAFAPNGWTTRKTLALAGKNIVLQPSEDVARFDSMTIGTARVHRYARAEDPESETEYVMWYHGRPKNFENDEKLPPLSTGRIGRATSRNGLIWVKDETGSSSEDVGDVSLGLNKESWWSFDTAHVGLGQVLLPMSTPAVMTEGGVYIMYYFGGSFEDAKVADFMEKVPEGFGDATIQGMKMKIGVAVSQDGMSWGRVEGDDPTGACIVPYDKKDPNTQFDTIPENVEEELYCGWPEVAVNLDGAASESFLMFYSTMTKEGKEKCIGHAVSEDGFRWYKKGISIRPDKTGLDAGGCARCCVLRDATYADGEWKEAKGWTMHYEGVSPEDGKHRILKATSTDGKTWKKEGLELDVGENDDWDCNGVGSPSILRLDDGSLRMYYTGQGKDGSTAVGVAKLSPGESAWVREQATISIA